MLIPVLIPEPDPYLEVIRDAYRRHKDVEPLVGSQVGSGRTAPQSEIWHFGYPPAIFRPDVEAGTDFVGNTGSVHAPDRGLLLGVNIGRARIADGQENQRPGPGLHKRIELFECETAYISGRYFLGTGQDLVIVGIADQVTKCVLVCDPVVGFESARRSQHEAVANQGSQSIVGVDLNVG